MSIDLPEGYAPKEAEPYMNPMQLEYFRRKLLTWKEELINESLETLQTLKEGDWQEADYNDRATVEEEAALELRRKDRCRKLIKKIDEALERVNDGSYGYCLETGDEIGLKRLEARPIATYSIEAQQRYENYEKQHNDE